MENSPLKSQNFDEIVFFSAGSEKSSVLMRTRFFGFRRKSKISQNYDFLSDLAAAKADGRINLIHHRILSCRHGALRTVEV